jgi:hypothetical protein
MPPSYPTLLGCSQGNDASPSNFTTLSITISIYIDDINIGRLNPTTRTNDEATIQERGGKLRQMEELEAIKLIEEQRLANKKKNSEARKLQEEEAMRKKDEDDALKKAEEATAAAVKATQEKEDEMADGEPVGNLNQNLHDILNGVATDPEPPEDRAPKDQQEERSPKMKRSGSSKTSSRRNKPTKVSPSEAAVDSAKKKISFEDTFIHPHMRVIIKLAILLKSDKAFRVYQCSHGIP